MALKRKRHKSVFNPVVRGKAVRLKAPEQTSAPPPVQEVARNGAPMDILPSDSHSSHVMLVITVATLLFIGFVTWCISQMPAAK